MDECSRMRRLRNKFNIKRCRLQVGVFHSKFWRLGWRANHVGAGIFIFSSVEREMNYPAGHLGECQDWVIVLLQCVEEYHYCDLQYLDFLDQTTWQFKKSKCWSCVSCKCVSLGKLYWLYQRVISVKVFEEGIENWNENEADNRNIFILMALNLVTILN